MARRIGERIRRVRLAARRQQTVVAGLAGITTDYLYQIERGLKLPSLKVLVELARVLDVSVAVLLGDAPLPGQAGAARVVRAPGRADAHVAPHAFDALPMPGPAPLDRDLYQAMTTVSAHAAEPSSPAALGDQVASAWRIWQSASLRYSKLVAVVPGLVAQTESQLRLFVSPADVADRREIARHASSLYGLLRSFCKRVGRMELALLAADRALRAAESADDAVCIAAAQWNFAHVLLAGGDVAGAEDTAMSCADELRSQFNYGGRNTAALHGSLLLVGATAAARRGDVWTARTRLEDARRVAEMTGETNTCGTVFGPTNVAMHAASVELVAGQATEGLRLAEQVDHRASPSIERRVAFLLDQAIAWRQKRENAQVLLLMETEREAPEDMRYRSAARNLIGHLVGHGRRPVAEQAAQMAERLQLAI
jgi:DNA-binding XRE family transcriptional regulator